MPHVQDLLAKPVMIHLATSNERHELTTTIFVAAAPAEDPAVLRLFIPQVSLGAGQRPILVHQEAAVSITEVLAYTSLQVKGTLVALRPATPDEQAIQREMFGRFVALNYPEKLLTMSQAPLVTAEVRVREIYDQTPGPDAGRLLAGEGIAC
jgi:hypothetical protein